MGFVAALAAVPYGIQDSPDDCPKVGGGCDDASSIHACAARLVVREKLI